MSRQLARTGRRLLLATALLLLILEIPGAVELLSRPDLGAQLRETTLMVVSPDGSLARAQLRAGDRILSVDDQPVHTFSDIRATLHGQGVGARVSLAVEREGARFETNMVLLAKEPREHAFDLLLSFCALCFLFLGFTTYLRRNDALGRTFYWTCLLLAIPFLDLPSFHSLPVMRLISGARDGAVALMPAFLLRFMLIFPEGALANAKRFRKQRWLMAPSNILAPLHLITAVAVEASWYGNISSAILLATTVIFATYLVGAMFVFFRKIRRRGRWALWTKLRLVSLGLIVGVSPLVLATVARQVAPTQPLWIDRAAVLLLPLVPASFSIALLRTQAIDLAYLLRQTLVTVFILLPAVVVGWYVVVGLGPHLRPDLRPWVYGAIPLVAVAFSVGWRYPHRPLIHWIDHVLYPEQNRVRSGALALGRKLGEIRDPDELLIHFTEEIRNLVGANRARIYRPEGGDWIRRAPLDPADARDRLDAKSVLSEKLTRAADLLLVSELPASHIDDDAREWLERIGLVLLCPLQIGRDTVAFLGLGGRKNGREYGELHLFHIASLCRQAASALDNARLHAEDLQHERVRTEMALAREIQERLLPQEDLRAGAIEVSGRTLSCREVGGDLFDHFQLSNGQIVLVVADAAGKGVPASLLVSAVRTAVRETVRPDLALPAAMKHINLHVFGMTDSAHFIALFLGLLDPESGVLEYVVAGAEPPFLFRDSAKDAPPLQLTRGGPLLGVTDEAEYRPGVLRLAPGDHLLAYSDGVIDEENEAGDEYGRSRLETIGSSCFAMSSREILDRILDDVSAYGSTEAVDDTTLLVVRRARSASAGTHPA